MTLTVWELSAAGVVAFISWGYLIHWIPVLRFLGYSFVIGSLCTLLLLLAIGLLSIESPQNTSRGEKSWERAAFVLPGQWKQEIAWLQESSRYRRKDILPSSSAVSEGLDELLDWMLRDFVASWYGNISSSPKFINQIDEILRHVMIEFRRRIESTNIAEVAVLRFVPILTTHMRDFYEAEHDVRGKKLNKNVTESEELDLAIASKYSDGQLHPAASLAYTDTASKQAEHLRMLVTRLLPILVPENIIESKAVFILVREIVSCAVLATTVRMLAEPDTWNQLLEGYGRTMLQDRKTVRKLRAALDQHASSAPTHSTQQVFPRLVPEDDDRKFERFVRAIRQCNNVSDARRFRSEVSSQLTRESMQDGQNTIYIRRLETGKRILDQRIGMLSAVGGLSKSNGPSSETYSAARSIKANANAIEILRDASGLSYFMEYMDRQQLMNMIQFWLVVDGFRNPLEDDQFDNSGLADSPQQWTEADRLDIAQISDAYLFRPELKVPPGIREDVRDFLKPGRKATINQYLKARAAILKTQTVVQEELQEKHLPGFRKSDLFYKYLTSEDINNKASLPMAYRLAHSEHSSSEALARKAPPSFIAAARFQGNLKRSQRSALDLESSLLGVEITPHAPLRKSLDHGTSGPLFDDDLEPKTAIRPRRSFDTSSANEGSVNGDQEQIVEAVEAALNTIMTSGPIENDLSSSQPDIRDLAQNVVAKSMTHEPLEFGHHSHVADIKREKPNLTSLGLVDTHSRPGVFAGNDLFGDEEELAEDERASSDEVPSDKEQDEKIHEAEPGDLGLAEAISALTMDIDKLVSQEAIVGTLTRKAELTNNVAELRILGKSKSSLQREIRRKELQRQQYMVQESDNSLFGRATVDISSVVVGSEEDGQEFAVYVISVKRQAGNHMPAAVWAVARRYSEFHGLHHRLRTLYPTVRNLEFPRRRLVMKLQNEFLEKRRATLEHYLRELLRLPAVCRSRDLRAFLSQRPILTKDEIHGDADHADIVSRIYNSVTDGMDEFLGNIPVLDQLSLAGQNLISAATNQYYANNAAPTATAITDLDGLDVQEARSELEAFDNQTLEPLVKPISELFLEIFELNRSPNWLRGRAVVVVLHQLLGGTVERKVRETIKNLFSEDSLLKYIAIVRDAIWPGGVLQREKRPRTEIEKRASRKEAGVVLAALVPELAGSIVGRANAQAASRRLFATLNNERLNTHLIFKLLDEAIAVLFPDSVSKMR